MRLTLLSAALQEYPRLRVTLLVDDPPNPTNPEHKAQLTQARALKQEIAAQLAEPHRKFARALEQYEREQSRAKMADSQTLIRLAAHYKEAAQWFMDVRSEVERTDHVDDFFVSEYLERMAQDLLLTGKAIGKLATSSTPTLSRVRVHQLYARLKNIFHAEFSTFERKQYVSLSHEPNKAMNLNSYIGLMGGAYDVVNAPKGSVLIPTDAKNPALTIPNSDYLLTLDADSILLPEYCLRLVYFLEQPENDDVAITQTPYSAYRGAQSRIERIAGATTDIQHQLHLGLTHYGATFWVGANAVIRKRALDQIAVADTEAGFPIRRYISDRTVIEDTESSIDLRKQGWRLQNYPERLSYSATPPDFGALVIQRRRWANGGLVILPNLFSLLRQQSAKEIRATSAEHFLRASYLGSTAWATIGLLILLFYPFDEQLLSRFAVLTAAPYWWMMASDLKRSGYHRRDIFQLYGFNLLLLPVLFVGTLQSIKQAIGGQRTAFARTPKVKDRTVTPSIYLLAPLLLIGWSFWTLLHDISEAAVIHGLFATANMLSLAFACLMLIGVPAIVVDLIVNLRDFVYVPVTPKTTTPRIPQWQSILYVGGAVAEEIDAGVSLGTVLAAQDKLRSTQQHTPATAEDVPSVYKSMASLRKPMHTPKRDRPRMPALLDSSAPTVVVTVGD